MRAGFGIWIALVLVGSCSHEDKREQCRRMADHVADVIMDEFTARPEQFWDALAREPNRNAVPTTRESFAAYLTTPVGKAWTNAWRAVERSRTHKMIDRCAQQATAQHLACMSAAKSRVEVTVCDLVP